MSEREHDIDAFLARAGWAAATRAPLPGDASFRRYVRLTGGGGTAMLMDAPPPKEDVRPYCRVARLLARLELSAPRILAENAEKGLLLIEDFGDDTFTRLLAAGENERDLYTLAIDLLIALNRRFVLPASDLPPYDDERLLFEASLLVDWFVPAIVGRPPDAALRSDYLELWQSLLSLARDVPETLVLRDYHVDNLMRLPRRDGIAACGLLDFQDAVVGPMSYDLVSLLEDARRDVPEPLAAAMRQRFVASFPAVDGMALDRSCAVLAAQRNAKIIGIFTRLCVRDGKATYLAHIPRVWRLLERDLRHPALAPLARWLDRHVPPEMRRIPACRPAA